MLSKIPPEVTSRFFIGFFRELDDDILGCLLLIIPQMYVLGFLPDCQLGFHKELFLRFQQEFLQGFILGFLQDILLGFIQELFLGCSLGYLQEFLLGFLQVFIFVTPSEVPSRIPSRAGMTLRTENVHSAGHFHIKTTHSCTHTEEHMPFLLQGSFQIPPRVSSRLSFRIPSGLIPPGVPSDTPLGFFKDFAWELIQEFLLRIFPSSVWDSSRIFL